MVARENYSNSTAADSSGGSSNSESNSNSNSSHGTVENNTSSAATVTAVAAAGADNHKLILKLPKPLASVPNVRESQQQESQEQATSSSSSSSNVSGNHAEDTRKVEPLKINLLQHTHNNNQLLVPKITIKPIFKQSNCDTAVSSDCSSSAEDELMLRTTVNAHVAQSDSSVDSSSPNSPNEPHILPKLTIRSANEDGGTAHTTIVPKLTIKMHETSSASTETSHALPPPLPKLTIKTTQDGSSGSIISSLSPASSSSCSSNSSCNAAVTSTAVGTISINHIPKLTIKTSATGGTCVSSTDNAAYEQQLQQESSNKIPKLMIKTAQEHAMILTQHSNDVSSTQSIPKLTIKTKTYKGEEEEDSHDKIPKLTIKTSEDTQIPKLTISGAATTPQSPRQQQNERVPKLMISRQQDNLMLVNNHCETKINFKTNAADECKDKSLKLLKKNNCLTEEQEKVPKLTIKNINNKQMQQLSITEDCHDMKTVPKLTIKNLCSPKLKIKAVLEEENTNGALNNNNEKINATTTTTTTATLSTVTTNVAGEERQRDSDDMDIDEGLKGHDPKIFNNISQHINDCCNNLTVSNINTAGNNSNLLTVARRVIDTVDLTSSPERSPAHITTAANTKPVAATTTPLLLERLQRDTSVIQTAISGNRQVENTSFLLNQLNAPLAMPNINRSTTVRQQTVQSRLLQQKLITQQPLNKNAKYPHLTERLMANGVHAALNPLVTESQHAGNVVGAKRNETVIDSIEILDTPDGSRSSLDENASIESVGEHQLNNGCFLREQPISSNKFSAHNEDTLPHYNTETNHMKSKKCLDESYLDIAPNKIRRVDHEVNSKRELYEKEANDASKPHSPNTISTYHCNNMKMEKTFVLGTNNSPISITTPHRSRKQKHDHLLTTPMDEVDPLQLHPLQDKLDGSAKKLETAVSNTNPIVKKRGRPKKNAVSTTPSNSIQTLPVNTTEQRSKSRRVQLLHKRLAIDMITAEQPFVDKVAAANLEITKKDSADTPRRAMRAARNSITPGSTVGKRGGRRAAAVAANKLATANTVEETTNNLHHFGGSNSSLSSGCSSGSLSSTTVTTTTTVTTGNLNVTNQIDLTMCSSSSSANSYGQTTVTVNAVDAITMSGSNNSMLPPAKILSSSDPVPDVVFKPNDFSSILVTQQLRANNSSQSDDNMLDGNTSSDNSIGSLSPLKLTPTRGRGRGRGSRGSRGANSIARSLATGGRGSRGHRLGRGASAVAKAIAMSRPRCVGGLKHTPDPKRLKGLISPSPQVFEEDTRMSADLTQIQLQEQQPAEEIQQTEVARNSAVRQLDFLNNDESQSSVISNTSILDPNTVAAMQNGASALKQRPKKKKMEVCVSEDEFTVSSIAEYDWPPPKGCCPSKNRDTFMIQEQVALYLGIKSFKRKYPDLPRRQIDMEERNWLQEKELVTEKMCDLGITAVWASDILDIMYADFYDKYEEYKDYVRQKHLREIEAKQKALGMSILGNGRNLQVRERAMLSASKFNSYFTRVRRSERVACLDLQSLTVNVPVPASSPASTILNRQMANIIAETAAAEKIPEPPTLLPKRIIDYTPSVEKSYPLALTSGQFSQNYRHYTPQELRVLPLQTALADVRNLVTLCDADNEDEDLPLLNTSRQKRHKRRLRHVQTANNSGCSESDDSDASSCSRVSATLSKRQAKSPTATTSSASATSSSTSASSDSDSTSSSDDEALHKCGVCARVQNSNLKQMPETFIKCYSCCRKVHPSCIEMPHRMVARVRNYNWQCADCKCCIKCKRQQDANKMLFCEQCDRGYHIYCLNLKTVPDGRWSCERCCVCMRCGATKPEGLTAQHQLSPDGSEKVKQIKHKKVKWINEYRIDHITKLREHSYMMCVPCARIKPIAKRVHIVTPVSNSNSSSRINNNQNNNMIIKTNNTLINDMNITKNYKNNTKFSNVQIVVTTATTTTAAATHPTTTMQMANINKKLATNQQSQIDQFKSTTTQQQNQKQTTNNKMTAVRTITTAAATATTTINSSNTGNGEMSLAAATTLPPPPVVA